MLKKLFFLNVFFLITTLAIVSAQTNVSFVDPGVTPDSFLYNLELIYEDIRLGLTLGTYNKVQLETQYTSERLAEINTMVSQEDFGAAQESARELNSLLETTETHINELSSSQETIDYAEFIEGTTFLNDLLEIQHAFIENSENAEAIKETLLANVENEVINTEDAALIINDVQEGITGIETAITEQKEDSIGMVSDTNNVPRVEIEIEVEKKEIELGTNEIMRSDITKEEIFALEIAIANVEKDILKSIEEGRQNEADTMEILLENAKLKLQIAENALENGDVGEAFGQFVAAEHLMLNADKISGKMFYELSEEDIAQINEGLGDDAQELRDEIERVISKDFEELDRYKDDLIQKYPEKREYIEKRYEQSRKVMELAQELSDVYSAEFERLRAEGKTEEEATVILTERFSDEFRKAYGEDYIPPGFVDIEKEGEEEVEIEVIPIGEIDKEFFNRYDEGGGFVKNNVYTDPVTGYQYLFGDKGFSYTTPAGKIYDVEYPENYEPETYSRGDEVYSYSYETRDGTYKYIYTSTGYEVEGPEGTTESTTYSEGKYEVVGGGEIEHKPTGFEYTSSEGARITYDYNPEYKHYVASDGKVYIPPEGTSYHSENTHYEISGKDYSYSYGGETWKYNPETNVWSSSTGETYRPAAVTGAPVGYEDRGTFTTENGEKWSYESSSGTWKSSSGKEYTPPPSSYYSYDSSSGDYTDYQGNTWTKQDDGSWVSSSGEKKESSQGSTSSFSDPSGKAWSYDSSAGVWSSSTGESYNPYTGTTTDSSGKEVSTYSSGGYQSSYSGSSYTDSSGKAWSYDSSAGVWSSSTGESYSAPSGETGGGYTSPGTYTSPYSGSYDSSGSYSGSYSGGSYSGGDGGSYSGGGDSGGASGGSSAGGGGGDSGGSSGGTGYTITGFAVKKYRLF